MLQRVSELTIKAANGTTTTEDREIIQEEIVELKEEIERISKTTQFNGVFSCTLIAVLNPVGLPSASNSSVTSSDVMPKTSLDIEVTDIGPMRLQIGANEGQVLEVEIPPISLRNMGIEKIDVSTIEGAKDAIDRMEGAIGFVSGVRGKLGAYQNRLESTVNSLDRHYAVTRIVQIQLQFKAVISPNSHKTVFTYSRLMDVDMAEEMTQYTTNQILTQAGTSMLAQANERPSQVLQLLQ